MIESLICFLLEIFMAVITSIASYAIVKSFLNKSGYKHKNIIIIIMTVIGVIMIFTPLAVIFYQIHWSLIWNFL
jgi:hypothetical protein